MQNRALYVVNDRRDGNLSLEERYGSTDLIVILAIIERAEYRARQWLQNG